MTRLADAATVHVAKVVGYWSAYGLSIFNPIHPGRTALVLDAIGHGPVVGTREVVRGQRFEVDDVVVTVGGTCLTWILVVGIGQKEMWAREHQVCRCGGITIFSSGGRCR